MSGKHSSLAIKRCLKVTKTHLGKHRTERNESGEDASVLEPEVWSWPCRDGARRRLGLSRTEMRWGLLCTHPRWDSPQHACWGGAAALSRRPACGDSAQGLTGLRLICKVPMTLALLGFIILFRPKITPNGWCRELKKKKMIKVQSFLKMCIVHFGHTRPALPSY